MNREFRQVAFMVNPFQSIMIKPDLIPTQNPSYSLSKSKTLDSEGLRKLLFLIYELKVGYRSSIKHHASLFLLTIAE